MSQPQFPGNRPPLPQYGKSELSDAQRRRQRTIIGGVAGCLGVLILATVLVGVLTFRAVKGAVYTGKVDRPTMQQKLGSDVPLYPNGTVDELMTRTVLSTTGIMGGWIKNLGAREPVAVALETGDEEQAIHEYYRRELGAQGWKEFSSRVSTRGADQITFTKGPDQVMLQVQNSPQSSTKRVIVLMRMQIPQAGAGPTPAPPQPTPPVGDFPMGGSPVPMPPMRGEGRFSPPTSPVPGR